MFPPAMAVMTKELGRTGPMFTGVALAEAVVTQLQRWQRQRCRLLAGAAVDEVGAGENGKDSNFLSTSSVTYGYLCFDSTSNTAIKQS
jgi:hypothetical protein